MNFDKVFLYDVIYGSYVRILKIWNGGDVGFFVGGWIVGYFSEDVL